MTGIQLHERRNRIQRTVTIGFLVPAVVLALVALWLIQTTATAPSGSDGADIAVAVPAREQLTASAALASEKPILFVFTPLEECAIRYCLTADVVERWVAERHGDQINVVEVPVYAAHVYTEGTPPPLFADWDLYPVEPFAEWMPQSELTDHGWGLSQSQIVFVSANHKEYYNLGASLDMSTLNEVSQ